MAFLSKIDVDKTAVNGSGESSRATLCRDRAEDTARRPELCPDSEKQLLGGKGVALMAGPDQTCLLSPEQTKVA